MALSCPRCTEKPFSAFRLLSLGPLRTARCQSCGCCLSVGWLGSLPFAFLFSLLPVTAAFFALFYAGAAFGGFAAVVVFVAAGIPVGVPITWVYARVVQLVSRYSD